MKNRDMKKYYKTFAATIGVSAFVLLIASPAFAVTLTNPLGTTDVNVLTARIIKSVLGVVGVIALIVIIYGGFEMLTSAGNEERVKRGREALLWAVIGIAIIFGSYGILQAVLKALGGESLL